MKRRRILTIMLCALLLTGCGRAEQPRDADSVKYPREAVELVAPAGAGGGYDLTVRCVADCLEKTKLVSVPLPVTNKPGGGGSVAMEHLEDKRGADDILTVYSPPLCLIHLNGTTKLNYAENTTPIARLVTDYGCFAVNADSKYATINDLMEDLAQDPASVRVGGTSSYGSMDHVQFLKAAKAAGVPDLAQIEYIGFEDGSCPAQLMSGKLDVISCGISDIVGLVENGELRVLAITADNRVGNGIVAQMPTCKEQGINATFYNWRGLFGPPDMPDYALDFWENTLSEMVQTEEWKRICQEYGWDMDYLGHEDFQKFLDEVNAEYAELLRDIGLQSAS